MICSKTKVEIQDCRWRLFFSLSPKVRVVQEVNSGRCVVYLKIHRHPSMAGDNVERFVPDTSPCFKGGRSQVAWNRWRERAVCSEFRRRIETCRFSSKSLEGGRLRNS